MDKSYIDYIKSLDIGGLVSEKVGLGPSWTVTKIMTRLKHRNWSDKIDPYCEDPIDVLYIYLPYKKSNFGKTFIVIYIPEEDFNKMGKYSELIDRIYTCTEFKKTRKTKLFCLGIDEPFDRIELSNGEALKLWKTPYMLRAVTDYDKDFRKEWQDGVCVYEGNNYGDTSNFYLIGCLDD